MNFIVLKALKEPRLYQAAFLEGTGSTLNPKGISLDLKDF